MDWIKVWATMEEAQELATGPWPGDDILGVALPSKEALRRKVEVRYSGKVIVATVLDVGPWCTDNDYWNGDLIPRAMKFYHQPCPVRIGGHAVASYPDPNCPGRMINADRSNGAGIDLFIGTCRVLGFNDNSWVEWRFV